MDNCLKVGFEPNERVLPDLSDASGGGISRRGVLYLLGSEYDRMKDILCRIHGIVLNSGKLSSSTVNVARPHRMS